VGVNTGLGWLALGLVIYVIMQLLIAYLRIRHYMKLGYIVTMDAIAALKDQIDALLNEPQQSLEQIQAAQVHVAELKQLRAIQARIEELEQIRTAQARVDEFKQLRATQARTEVHEALQAIHTRIGELEQQRVKQARVEELQFLQTIDVASP